MNARRRSLVSAVLLALSTTAPLAPAADVQLKGEYAAIDTSAALRQMEILAGPDAPAAQALLDAIQANPGDYMPPVFFPMARRLFDAGEPEPAYFWYAFGRLRARYDAARCADESAAAAVDALIETLPRELRSHVAQIDPDDVVPLFRRLVRLDKKTPRNYDHRWINLHGLHAILNQTPLSLPESQWPPLLAAIHRDYLEGAEILAQQLRSPPPQTED